jgi:20S proteasome alpha/beta subunit
VTGTSVLGVKFNGGVVLATDNLGVLTRKASLAIAI